MLIVILGCHEIVKNVYIYKAERWNIIDMDINFGFNQSFSKTYICRFLTTLKTHEFVQEGCYFFRYSFASLMTNY